MSHANGQEFNAVTAFVDATGGAGAGWVDSLLLLGRAPIGVQFAGQAHEAQRYANKRAEMYFDAVNWIKRGGAIPPDDNLIAQLTATTYTYEKRGDRFLIEPKEMVKAKLNGHSPDEADAFILTFAEPVGAADTSSAARGTPSSTTRSPTHPAISSRPPGLAMSTILSVGYERHDFEYDPYETLALIVAEQQIEIYRLRRELEKWPTRVESESSLRAFRNAVIEECAKIVDAWDRGFGTSSLAKKIRALAHN